MNNPASTLSSARWAAAGLLGGASIVGMLWAIIGRAPAAAVQQIAPPPPARAVLPPPSTPAEQPRPASRRPVSAQPPSEPRATSAPDPVERTMIIPSSVTKQPEPIAERAPTPTAPARIDINNATKAELELLPRIGPTLAARIIEFRDREGRIRSLTHLMGVKGIGSKTVERLEPYIRFE